MIAIVKKIVLARLASLAQIGELARRLHWPLGEPDVNVVLNLPASHIFAQPNNNYI